MKKIISICVTLAMVFALFTFTASAATNPGDNATGKITLSAGWVSPDSYRNDLQYSGYGNFAWLKLPYWGGAGAELYKKTDGGEVPIGAYENKEVYTFEGLEDGVYVVKFPFLKTGRYSLVQGVVNGGPMPNLITSDGAEITIANGANVSCQFVAEYKAFGFKTVTELGTYKNGSQINDYYPTTAENGSRNWSFENPNTSSNATILNTHSGIYYGDSADLYKGMNYLEVPKLSAEEEAKGYKFVGWQLEGDESEDIYTDSMARAMKIRQDTTFKAVWEYPNHTVTFKTAKDFGTIKPASNDEGTSYKYGAKYNNQKIGELSESVLIPEATPKDGYEFEGWYMDLTMDTLTEEEIKSIVVDKDIVLYAKYKPIGKQDEDKTSEKPANIAVEKAEPEKTVAETVSKMVDTKLTPESSASEDKETENSDIQSKPNTQGSTTNSGGVVKSTVTTSGAKRYSDVSTGDESELAIMWIASVASLAALTALAGIRRRKAGE